MAYEQRDNSGTLGKNTRRETDKHPEYAGAAVIGGVGYWVSGWVKANGATGEKFFSLSFKPKDERPAKPAKAAPAAVDPDLDMEIPF